ncbi:MAG: hypothetical protein U0401_26600 [Anaerolineae bacterium]
MAFKTETRWQNIADNEEDDLPAPPSRLRIILSRAVKVYLGLFLGISQLLSLLGVDPLTHNGLMPQCLGLYVGFSVLLALAQPDETNLVDEQVRSRLALFAHWPGRKPLSERKINPD